MSAPGKRLDQPLPAEVLRRTNRGLAAYQTYPVFSWPWLRKRTGIFTLALASFGALSALGAGLGGGGTGRAWSVFVHFTVGGLTIATSGPLLATLVRHRQLPLKLERILVVTMLVLGLGISFAADSWASRAIERNLPQAAELAPKPPEPGGAALALNLFVVASIIVGGLIANRRWHATCSYRRHALAIHHAARHLGAGHSDQLWRQRRCGFEQHPGLRRWCRQPSRCPLERWQHRLALALLRGA